MTMILAHAASSLPLLLCDIKAASDLMNPVPGCLTRHGSDTNSTSLGLKTASAGSDGSSPLVVIVRNTVRSLHEYWAGENDDLYI